MRWPLVLICSSSLFACNEGTPSGSSGLGTAVSAGVDSGGTEGPESTSGVTTGDGSSTGSSATSGSSGGGSGSGGGGTSAGTSGSGSSGPGSSGDSGGIEAPPCAEMAAEPGWGGGVFPQLLTVEPYTMKDTGLGDVNWTLSQLEFGKAATDIQVSGVIVTAAGEKKDPQGRNRFWVADADYAFLVKLGPGAKVAVEPGDSVSFRVSEVRRETSEPIVSEILELQVVSPLNQVQFIDPTTPLTFGKTGHRLHRIHGLVGGAPTPCGGFYECQPFTYYVQDVALETILRFDTMLFDSPLAAGECAEIQAPLGFYEFEHLDVQNTDWFRTYEDG